MSTAENLVPEPLAWDLSDPEAERVRREDPGFPEAQCRALAKAKGETYRPEKHGPFAAKLPPRQEREQMQKPEIDVEALLARFRAKAPAPYRPQAVSDPPDNPGVRRVHNR